MVLGESRLMKITAIRCFVAILCTLVASCAKEDPGIHHGPYVYVLEGGDVEIRWRTAEPGDTRDEKGDCAHAWRCGRPAVG